MTELVTADTPLVDLEERGVGLALSSLISARLDALVKLVEGDGVRTSRKELVAALLLAAVPDGEELGDLIRAYRKGLARDAFIGPDYSFDHVTLETRRPGPRRRRSR